MHSLIIKIIVALLLSFASLSAELTITSIPSTEHNVSQFYSYTISSTSDSDHLEAKNFDNTPLLAKVQRDILFAFFEVKYICTYICIWQ